MACDRAETNVTAGPAVCVHCTFVNAPVQPATTAPAALPTATFVSTTTEKLPLPVHVGVGAIGTTGGAGAGGFESLPPPHAVSSSASTAAGVTRIKAAGAFISSTPHYPSANSNDDGQQHGRHRIPDVRQSLLASQHPHFVNQFAVVVMPRQRGVH